MSFSDVVNSLKNASTKNIAELAKKLVEAYDVVVVENGVKLENGESTSFTLSDGMSGTVTVERVPSLYMWLLRVSLNIKGSGVPLTVRFERKDGANAVPVAMTTIVMKGTGRRENVYVMFAVSIPRRYVGAGYSISTVLMDLQYMDNGAPGDRTGFIVTALKEFQVYANNTGNRQEDMEAYVVAVPVGEQMLPSNGESGNDSGQGSGEEGGENGGG